MAFRAKPKLVLIIFSLLGENLPPFRSITNVLKRKFLKARIWRIVILFHWKVLSHLWSLNFTLKGFVVLIWVLK